MLDSTEIFIGVGLVAFVLLILGFMVYKCAKAKARPQATAKAFDTPSYEQHPSAPTVMEDGRGSGSFVVLQDKHVRDSNILGETPAIPVSAKIISFGSMNNNTNSYLAPKPVVKDDIAILEDEEDDDMMIIQNAPTKKLGDALDDDDFDIVDQDLYRSSTSFAQTHDNRYSHFSMVSELSAYETASEYESRTSAASRDSYMTDYDGKEARI
ncbi:hypothetical protein THRCLA_02267 [Thraustotheca clavata]|uniref:Uncharacterized protein n=1 Tax=Thraustotheca clavata TaxID=74557 RepID=A0A1W0A622_9STRA|nr:hypothetical protein THRCLA_02267 [Thraustotheca clavata]